MAPTSSPRVGWTVRRAADPGSILGDVGDTGRDRLARRAGSDIAAVDRHAPGACPQAGDDLGELRLAVACDGRDPDDLAGTDV
jgi:hypothetical protein